jgi:hypothetical protein
MQVAGGGSGLAAGEAAAGSVEVLINASQKVTVLQRWNAGISCSGLNLWEKQSFEQVSGGDMEITEAKALERLKVLGYGKDAKSGSSNLLQSKQPCLVFLGEFDKAWKEQKKPDPAVTPRTHLIRSRIEPLYEASAGRSKIKTSRVRLFRVLKSGSAGGSSGSSGGTNTAATNTNPAKEPEPEPPAKTPVPTGTTGTSKTGSSGNSAAVVPSGSSANNGDSGSKEPVSALPDGQAFERNMSMGAIGIMFAFLVGANVMEIFKRACGEDRCAKT